MEHYMKGILSNEGQNKILVLGNEAIVRGALESGIDVVTTYPGTPSSEIGDVFFKIADELGIYFEYSTNEKVALEAAIAASISGLSTMTVMKHVGLNVASDAFVSLAYVGVRGAHVIVSADDPGSHSSQNEQDNRWYAKLANIPMLEPSTPQEAKDMMIYAFELSHKTELPVLFRTTTRVSHTRAPILLGEIKKGKGKSIFEKDPKRFMLVPEIAIKDHNLLIEKMDRIQGESELTQFNFIVNPESESKLGIIASGVSWAYCVDTIKKLNLQLKVLKLGLTHPIPKKMIAEFLNDLKTVVILEELDPYLEREIKSVAGEEGISIKILGKESGHFPKSNEYNPDIVEEGIVGIIKEHHPEIEIKEPDIKIAQAKPLNLPTRPPVLCPGCPHRATAYAAQKASGPDTIYPMDIGCYTLVFEPPLKTADMVLCMGSSVGTACGFSKATNQNIIAFIGDSTFFHAGIPGLINAVSQGHNFVLSILDNRTTAMTGFQPHPGVEKKNDNELGKTVDILEVVKGCGVESVFLVDPYDLSKTIVAYHDALAYKGLSVVIARHPCALIETREKKKKGEKIVPYTVDQKTCIKCYTCTNEFGCPASWKDVNEYPKISQNLCVGCGVCAVVCPTSSIKLKEKGAGK
jgi:indolepyruvate ferredoxin oxidoreductase alpha subunit